MAEGQKPVSDDGVSHASAPVAPAGGTDKMKSNSEMKKKLDLKTPGNSAVKEDSDYEVEESMQAIFEGMDLSEDFKSKISLVFEAAVSENVALKLESIQESLTLDLEEQLQESIADRLSAVVENVDSYLDYVVNEWMEENEIAIESGIKVSMAESLMSGLSELFSQHNIDIDESTVDVVSGLEEELSQLGESSNKVINENIRLNQKIAKLHSEKAFEAVTEGLTVSQRERMKTLSENLDSGNSEKYPASLKTLKESFFGEKRASAPAYDVEETHIMTEEEEAPKSRSDYGSINALVESFNKQK